MLSFPGFLELGAAGDRRPVASDHRLFSRGTTEPHECVAETMAIFCVCHEVGDAGRHVQA